MADYMKKMLDWERPTGAGHWPPYNDFVNTDYDPNRWEAFDMFVLRHLLQVLCRKVVPLTLYAKGDRILFKCDCR